MGWRGLWRCLVSCFSTLSLNIQIPVCLWFLANDKTQSGRDRWGEMLFVDARRMGTMETRVNRVFTDADINAIAGTVDAWRRDGEVPDAYENVVSDDEPFDQKMKRLTALLKQQQAEGQN